MILVPLILAACAPASKDSSAAPQQVTLVATEFAFAGPDSIAPGVTEFRLVNRGSQIHHAILGQLQEGKTADDVMAAMRQNPMGEPPYMSWHGAVGVIQPGDSAAGAVEDLPAGHYMLICFMQDPADGSVHAMKGMVKEFVAAGPRHEAPLPAAHVEIHLKDFSFVIPELGAGTHTVHVINDGPQTHEFQVIRLNEGVTSEQFMAGLAPGATAPPPGVFLGGPGAFSAGSDAFYTLTLTPGKYLFVCFVPDAQSGQPHILKGMVREMDVT